MSKFYFTMINDLRRSIYLISSSSVLIPVEISMFVDPSRVEINKQDHVKIKAYSNKWKDELIKYIKETISREEFDRFEFRFIVKESTSGNHKISYDILVDEANQRIQDNLNRAKEESRIRYAQDTLKDMQDAYLSQDVDNNDFESGSRIPDVGD